MPLPALAIAETVEEPLSQGVVIPLPSGFKAPHNKRDGDEFEILVKATKEGDQLRLHSADGFTFSAPEEVEEPEMEVEEEMTPDEASDEEATLEDDEGEGLMASIQKARSGKMSYR